MKYSLLPDEILLKLLRTSEEIAYKTIYERYWKNLWIGYKAVTIDYLQ